MSVMSVGKSDRVIYLHANQTENRLQKRTCRRPLTLQSEGNFTFPPPSVTESSEEPDTFDLGYSSPGNEVLGSGCSDSGAPLFFTAMFGLVTLVPNDPQQAAAMAAGTTTGNQSRWDK
jgi:hypothetical protein